jgi:hypothetical protein
MYGSVILWLAKRLGVSTLIIQIGLVSVLFSAGFWFLKVREAKVYSETYKKAELIGIEKQKKINMVEWEKRSAEIAAAQIEYDRKATEIIKQNDELLNAVIAWKKKYNDVKDNVIMQMVEIPKIVEVIPQSELVDVIRSKSAELVEPIPLTGVTKTGIFSDPEERLLLSQVMELGVRRTQVKTYETLIEEDKVNDVKKDEICKLQIDNEKSSTEIVKKELDVAVEKSKFFEQSYNTCSKGRTKKCWFMKIITAGMYKCR